MLADVDRVLRGLPGSHRAFRIVGDEVAAVLLGCDAGAATDMIAAVRGNRACRSCRRRTAPF